MRLYQDAITRTYDKFCKFCNDEFENWLSLNDDDDGFLREAILEQHENGDLYRKSHEINTWWLDIPDQKKYIIKFLQVLCVNPIWDLGYRHIRNVSDFSKHYLPCWCPCHKRFKPYYDKMSNAFLSSNQVLECTSSKKPYKTPQAFKAHLHDTNDWIHKLLHIFVTELYEVKPNEYINGSIKPIPINESEYKSQKSVNNIPVSCHKTKG